MYKLDMVFQIETMFADMFNEYLCIYMWRQSESNGIILKS